MKLIRAGTQPSIKGPAEYFTGTVRIDPSTVHRSPRGHRAPASRSSLARVRPGTAMTHNAIQEALDGRNVVRLEHVTNEDCLAGPPDGRGQ